MHMLLVRNYLLIDHVVNPSDHHLAVLHDYFMEAPEFRIKYRKACHVSLDAVIEVLKLLKKRILNGVAAVPNDETSDSHPDSDEEGDDGEEEEFPPEYGLDWES